MRTLKHRVDHFKGLVDLFSNLRTSQNNLAGDEDEENDLGLDHTIDQTREQLRLIRAEIVMARSKTLQTNGELDVARADNVLDLAVRELGIEAKYLWVVFGVPSMQGVRLEVQTAIKIDRGNDVSSHAR